MLLKLAKKIYSKYLLLNNSASILIEKARGVDFSKEHSLHDLGLSEDTSVYYGTAGSFRLKRIMSSIQINENDSFIDFGCGKGKIIYLMSQFPFKRIDGVEISEKLCSIAQKNLSKLNVKNFQIFHSDARIFKKVDEYNYIYFFNPFPSLVMEDVMKNIELSLLKFPRIITIIYFNPVCHNEIIKSGVFFKFMDKWNVSLYTNNKESYS